MREILFRGKATNREPNMEYRTKYKNGDWVYGLITDTENYMGFAEMTNTDGVSRIEIDKNTVGQYTGLTDKNGKKIFEGDIVKYKDISNFAEYEELEEVGRENPDSVIECINYVKWHEKAGCFSPLPERYDCGDSWYSYGTYDFEVIGNIHDNPELLTE